MFYGVFICLCFCLPVFAITPQWNVLWVCAWLKEAVIKFCTRSGSYSKCEKILEFLEMPKAEVCGPGGFPGTNTLILIVQIIKNKNLYAFTMCQSMTSTVSTYRS